MCGQDENLRKLWCVQSYSQELQYQKKNTIISRTSKSCSSYTQTEKKKKKKKKKKKTRQPSDLMYMFNKSYHGRIQYINTFLQIE